MDTDEDALSRWWSLELAELALIEAKPMLSRSDFAAQLKPNHRAGHFADRASESPDPAMQYLAVQVKAISADLGSMIGLAGLVAGTWPPSVAPNSVAWGGSLLQYVRSVRGRNSSWGLNGRISHISDDSCTDFHSTIAASVFALLENAPGDGYRVLMTKAERPRRTDLPEAVTLRERLGALRHLPRLFREVWKASPQLTVLALGLRLVKAFQPILVLYVGKLIVDEIVAFNHLIAVEHILPRDIDFTAWLTSGRLTRIGEYIGLELCLVIGFDGLTRLVSVIDQLLSEKHSNILSMALMAHAASLDLQHFESSDHQDQLERARRQATGRSTLLAQVFSRCQDLSTLITLAVGLLAYAPSLIVLLMIALIPAFVSETHFNAAAYRLNFGRTEERRQLDYLRYIGVNGETAKEVKLFGLAEFLMGRFKRLAFMIYAANKKLAIRQAFWGGLFFGLSTLAYYVAYAIIIWRTISGTFSIGDLTFLAGSFLRLHGLFQSLLLGLTQVAAQALYLEDLFGFFDVEPNIQSPSKPLRFPPLERLGICFENVGFRYPETDRWAVRQLSFTLKPAQVLALVGENGAGKTTIVKLLTRLYDPDEGRILVEGIDLKALDLNQLHTHIGVIFQDFVRYNLSALENIAVGQIESIANVQKIKEAAERSLAAGIIDRLPLGYAQPLGKRFKQGRDLSGGEWQKIALARAYLRDARCLILDEPTAALDARAEAQVFERFKEICQGKSAILISHRFSTVRMADQILVLEDGRILEQGTHPELVTKGGRYAELFEMQARGYR